MTFLRRILVFGYGLWRYRVIGINSTESYIFKLLDDHPLRAIYGALQSEELTMSEEDTYVRAKLTEINGAIERLTQMLNRMIEVISAITEVQENTSELTQAVNANTERLDGLIQMVQNLELGTPVASASKPSIAERGAVSNLQSVLDTLETQVREGVIASDLAQRINESAEILEGKGAAGSLVVKMQRWTRILRTYGRVDTISPTDIAKLRADIKEWGKELSKMR